MRSRHATVLVLLAVCAATAGCHHHKHCYRGGCMAEPVLDPGYSYGSTSQGLYPSAQSMPMAVGPTVASAKCGGRHPLCTKPHAVYDRTQGCGLHKVAAATFIGVPAGIVGEMKQIFCCKGHCDTVGY